MTQAVAHIHVTSNGNVIGTLTLGERGSVVDDGTPAAKNAIDHMNHGRSREDGQVALDAIVAHLDRSTLVGAHHCDEDHQQFRSEQGRARPGQD
jgi:hypothetical protein